MPDELTRLIRRLAPRRPPPAAFLAEPGSAFEPALAARLRSVEADLAEVRGRVNGLLFVVAGAAVTQIVMRLVG